jgi:ribosomal protein S18 acetylase RimI-like enzyme
MEIREDRWLSIIFGKPVFKVEALPTAPMQNDSFPHLGELIKRHARQQSSSIYYAKVDTEQIEVVRQLSLAGLYVVDVNVTFTMDAKAPLTPDASVEPSGLSIREIEVSDHEETLEIAGSCFQYSRFHLDPFVSLPIANQVKRDWILNYIKHQRGERLFVALVGGRPAGFLAVIASEMKNKRVCTIDLIGVSRNFQRRGIGQALTAFFIKHYRERADYLQVGTQAANIPSMRLYQKLGFYISRTQYVMHGHLGHDGLNA